MIKNRDFEFTIEAGRTERNYWKDIWRYRELFYILAWRDLTVRYKQTVIGILWAIIKPLLTMVIFVIVFGKIAKLPSEGVPYPIYVFAAMLPWTFFSTAFTDSGKSLVSNSSLISKVYFPRLVIPASSVIVAAVDFIISFAILILMMFYYSFIPSWQIMLIPVFLLMGFFTAFGAGLFISSLNVKYRDCQLLIPFIVQMGLYVSPVAFSTTLVPEKYRIFYYFNPMVAVIDGFRWAVTGGTTAFNMTEVSVSLFVIIALCITGIVYFRKTEKNFADIV